MRNELGKLDPRLAAGLKTKLAAHQRFGLQTIGITPADFRRLLAVPFLQFRLGIEQIHLTGATVLEQHNDRLGLRRKMPSAGRHVELRVGVGCGASDVTLDQAGERHSAESQTRIV